MRILGIESSADDSGVALIDADGHPPSGGGKNFSFKILANEISSQSGLHAEYGGIYPNLAKREHAKNLPILSEKISEEAKDGYPFVRSANATLRFRCVPVRP